MARKRFLSPDIWSDAFFVKLSPQERLLFIGMITLADDEGRLRAEASYLKGEIFPKDDLSEQEVAALRDRLARRKPSVYRYKVAGMLYVLLPNWRKYQAPSHPSPSRLPPPPYPSPSHLPPPPRFKNSQNPPEDSTRNSRELPESEACNSRSLRDLGMGVGRGMGKGMGSNRRLIPYSPLKVDKEFGVYCQVYEAEIGPLTPLISESLQAIVDDPNTPVRWFEEAVKIAAKRGHRNLGYVEGILRNYQAEGFHTEADEESEEDDAEDAVERWRKAHPDALSG